MEKPIKIWLFETRNNLNSLNVIAGAINSKYDKYVEITYEKSFEKILYQHGYVASSNFENLPKMIFLSFTSVGFYEIAQKLDLIKKLKINDKFLLVAGGTHPSAKPLQVLEKGVDYVCRGEGEKFICDFIESIINNADISKISGLSYLKEDELKDNGYAETVNLDDFPPFNLKQKRFNAIEITRGCMYACSFCQTPFLFKSKFRHRSVENICHYVEILAHHGLKDIRFITPSALSYGSYTKEPELEKVEELLSKIKKIIAEKGRIFFGTFPSEVRPEHITPSALQMLKRYVSNNNLVIGAQSGSDEILKRCHRGHDVETIIRAVRYCKEEGFLPNVDFIFGFPDETEADQEKTIKLMEYLIKFGARIHAHYFIPLPGSPWGNKTPSPISEKLRNKIEKLTSSGTIYGVWKHQENFVKQMQ